MNAEVQRFESNRGASDATTLDAYTRIALRLRDLSAADREWLLGKLAVEDCRRVSAALRRVRARGLVAGPESGSPANSEVQRAGHVAPGGSNSHRGSDPAMPVDDEAARLMRASLPEVQAVFAGQPDWAVAVVLAARPWPWMPSYLAALDPNRIRALRSLTAELSARVKPSTREHVLRAIASKLTPDPAVALEPAIVGPFDAALERATLELSANRDWRMERA